MTNPDDVTTSPMVAVPLAEAASRLGLSVAALRSRIRRGVVTAKRGNDGRLHVEVAADAQPRHDVVTASPDATVAELQGEIGELRELLARAEAERDAAESVAEAQVAAARDTATAQIEAARDTATARVNLAKLEIAAVRELADRLTAELADARRARVDAAKAEAVALRELADRLTDELAEARRPWWRRLIG